jgi:hypothetical protein
MKFINQFFSSSVVAALATLGACSDDDFDAASSLGKHYSVDVKDYSCKGASDCNYAVRLQIGWRLNLRL